MTSRMDGRGFTLVESLVALVVLSVGLLGAAATLLGSLGAHGEALRRAAAVNLVRDVAERIRANTVARNAYDTRGAPAGAASCDAAAACNAAALAAMDRAHFAAAARALFPFGAPATEIRFEPAIGAAAPDRYVISLRFAARSRTGATDGVVLTVLAVAPVAGGA
jgi:type IV pilus modification protein PilV